MNIDLIGTSHIKKTKGHQKTLTKNDFWFLPVIDDLIFKGFISKNKILSNYREKLKEAIIE